jgi:hypothetical protein
VSIEFSPIQNPRNRFRPIEGKRSSARWVEGCSFDLVLYDPGWQVRSESLESKNAHVTGAMRGFSDAFVFFED